MSRPRAPRPRATPLRSLVTKLLAAPLLSLPIALFFLLQEGRGRAAAGLMYLVTLVLSVAVSLAIWLVEVVVVPFLDRDAPQDGEAPGAMLRNIGVYSIGAAVGTLAGAFAVRATLVPDLLGSPRAIALFAVYFLIFLGLSLGITLAGAFYRRLEERTRADQELRLARRIQSAFLPTEFAAPPGVDVHAVNAASRQVSGDFYDVVPAPDGSLLLAIADVSGKGVPAALLSSMLQASLRTQAGAAAPVSRMLVVINTLLLQQNAVGRFATFFLARLDPRGGRVTYSNAGHNPPLLRRADGTLETLETGGTVVGILSGQAWEEGSAELHPGDRLVLYTDGITEAGASGGEFFGDERLRALVGGLPCALPSRDAAARVLEAVDRFTGGAEPDDDRTLLLVRIAQEAA